MIPDLAAPTRIDGIAPGAPGASRPAAASTALRALLSAPVRPARVLGAGRSAIYLEVEGHADGHGVLAVVAPGAVLLPVALAPGGPLPLIAAGASASVGGGEVTAGELRLHAARWFDPRPRLGGPPLSGPLAEARRALAAIPPGATGVAAPADRVAAGLLAGDPGPALRLIGLGPGLTPAGDDVVAGVLAALALCGDPDPAAVAAVLAHTATATTALSAALLRCAAEAQVIPQSASVLHAFCGRGALAPALTALLAVGSTSGAALALGLTTGAAATLMPSTEARS